MPEHAVVAEKNGVSLIEVASPAGPRYVVRSVQTPVERRFDDLAAAQAELDSWVANGGLPKD
jgi:hypothetical protein